MRIPSGKTDQSIYFVAFATADGSRLTGLSGFTVYRSRNGAAEVAYTTPTITEIDATNMPGVYALLVDEDTTIASTSDSEEYCLQFSNTGMEPVTRTIELYRRDTTSGQTLTVSSGNGNAAVQSIVGGAITSSTFANNSITSAVMSNAARDAISVNVWSYGGNRTLTSAGTTVSNEIADALLDRSAGIETGLTPRQAWRVIAAACAGKASGLNTTTAVYRNAQADSVDRITATVDADGNRTAVTLDLT